jgi:protein-disulfide isomerase
MKFSSPLRALRILPLLAAMAVLWSGCVASGGDARLRAVESKQDSILTLLRTISAQSEFVALRVGWRPAADTGAKRIPLEGSFSTGPEKALITLVEFSDFQCPYCARLAPVLDSVAHAYPREVRLVFKHFPLSFHAQARAAAAAAIAAGKQGKFFEFRALIMPQYRTLSEDAYLAAAQQLRLDMNRFRKDMVLTDAVQALLDNDIALGREVGVEGTPTVFVNGKLAEDRSFEYFASLVAEARAQKR